MTTSVLELLIAAKNLTYNSLGEVKTEVEVLNFGSLDVVNQTLGVIYKAGFKF